MVGCFCGVAPRPEGMEVCDGRRRSVHIFVRDPLVDSGGDGVELYSCIHCCVRPPQCGEFVVQQSGTRIVYKIANGTLRHCVVAVTIEGW